MSHNISARSPVFCPYPHLFQSTFNPDSEHQVQKKGAYFRASDRKRIQRYLCLHCRRSFSRSTRAPEYRQKKRQLNLTVRNLLCSNVSQRRIPLLLSMNRKTVVRKLLFLAHQAERNHQAHLKERARLQEEGIPFQEIQFDEMETFEKSKCLPLSIPLVVEKKTRKILGFQVCEMPAKGPLAAVSRRRYGPRADHRSQSARELFLRISPYLAPSVCLMSDENPKYPAWIRSSLPGASHTTVKGRRGCVVGQGELKRGGFDPLFDLNHTAAMFRANINRLGRRTWCTTKRADRLAAHIQVYVDYHNHTLTEARSS